MQMLKSKTGWAVLLLTSMAGSQVCLADLPLIFWRERPSFNHYTNDPRPDIWTYPVWNAWPEYRRTYNRPRYVGGYLAHKVAPSSQEAMVWCENVAAGRYDKKHTPPVYKRYFAPKPWEVLNTGARPDFPEEALANQRSAVIAEATEIATDPEVLEAEVTELPRDIVPPPLDASPSDR